MKLQLLRPPVYGDRTLKLAFEFGLVLSETAKKLNIEVTPEIAEKAEKILIRELRLNGLKNTAYDFTPLIMVSLVKEPGTGSTVETPRTPAS